MSSKMSVLEQVGINVNKEVMGDTIQEIFNHTGLNWNVLQEPVYTSKGEIPNLVANYRSDTGAYLGTVNPKIYKVVQNIEAFNFVDSLSGFTLEKVGTFEKGRKVFVVGKSDVQMELDRGDTVDMYFTFLHGHDGKSGIRLIVSPIRMFCTNQLNLMLSQATYTNTIRHSGDISSKLCDISNAMSNIHVYTDSLQSLFIEMMNTKFDTNIDDFVLDLIPDEDNDAKWVVARKEEQRNAIVDLYNNKDDLQNYKGTAFGVLNAVSDFISHSKPLRKSGDSTLTNMFIKNINNNVLLERTKLLLGV